MSDKPKEYDELALSIWHDDANWYGSIQFIQQLVDIGYFDPPWQGEG